MATLAGRTRGGGVPHERMARVPRRAARSKSDILVMMTTFFLTVAVDLTLAIEVAWCSRHSCS